MSLWIQGTGQERRGTIHRSRGKDMQEGHRNEKTSLGNYWGCTEDYTQRPGEASWGRGFGYISSRAGGDPAELISKQKKLLEK